MCTKFLFFIYLSCHFSLNYGDLRIDPLVETKLGLIRGLHASDGDYSMFLGIPYARVDENNPFGPAIPQPEFDDIFVANDDSAICPQNIPSGSGVEGAIDCLHLNVYVPNSASSSNRLPVMVWIYGGAFYDGYFSHLFYGPTYLVRHDVIVVSLNYRLGPYGFMCLNTPKVPGNQGLKDQRLALRWVKDNIASFGGDDENITGFGESAGATSVDLHFRFNEEKLFDKIILQSGSASTPWAVHEPDLDYSKKLSKLLGYETNDVDLSVQFLNNIDFSVLIEASSKIDSMLRPCPEKDFDGHEKLISEYAMNIKMPHAKTTPILLGFTDEEWLVYFVNINEESFKNVDEFNDSLYMGFNFTADEQIEMEDLLKNFYIGNNEISKAVEVEIGEFASDFYFIHPITRSIGEYFKDGASTIYQFMFSYYGERNFNKLSLNYTGSSGAFHADELGYLFSNIVAGEPNERDQLMIDRMTTLWTNFAKLGDPTPDTSELLPVKWPTVTPEKHYYLNMDEELILDSRPFHQRMAFFDLFYEMNEHKRKGYRNNDE